MIAVRAKATRWARAAFSLLDRLRFFPPLLARVTLGVLFMSTGWGKAHRLDKVTAFFSELGIVAPAFNAVLVSWTELIGGSLLLVGLASRLAAVPLAISMIVAVVTAKASGIHGLADLFGTVEFTYIVLLVWVAIAGPGWFSLDRLVFGRKCGLTPVTEGPRHARPLSSLPTET